MAIDYVRSLGYRREDLFRSYVGLPSVVVHRLDDMHIVPSPDLVLLLNFMKSLFFLIFSFVSC